MSHYNYKDGFYNTGVWRLKQLVYSIHLDCKKALVKAAQLLVVFSKSTQKGVDLVH